MTTTIHATVAIPTLNPDREVFRRVLSSALSLGRPVVVVDMSSDERVAHICRAAGSLVKYEHFGASTGVSQSRNRCVELAGPGTSSSWTSTLTRAVTGLPQCYVGSVSQTSAW